MLSTQIISRTFSNWCIAPSQAYHLTIEQRMFHALCLLAHHYGYNWNQVPFSFFTSSIGSIHYNSSTDNAWDMWKDMVITVLSLDWFKYLWRIPRITFCVHDYRVRLSVFWLQGEVEISIYPSLLASVQNIIDFFQQLNDVWFWLIPVDLASCIAVFNVDFMKSKLPWSNFHYSLRAYFQNNLFTLKSNNSARSRLRWIFYPLIPLAINSLNIFKLFVLIILTFTLLTVVNRCIQHFTRNSPKHIQIYNCFLMYWI